MQHRPSVMVKYMEMVQVKDEMLSRSRHEQDMEEDISVCSFGSHADLHRLGETPVPGWVAPGVPVNVLFSSGGSKSGHVQFVGLTEFAAGNWVGVALDQPEGKNDGCVKGVRYFKCKSRHGIFVRHDKLILDKKRKSVTPTKGRASDVRKSTGNLHAGSPDGDRAHSPRNNKNLPGFMRGTFSSGMK